jgi:hypothetical protein
MANTDGDGAHRNAGVEGDGSPRQQTSQRLRPVDAKMFPTIAPHSSPSLT